MKRRLTALLLALSVMMTGMGVFAAPVTAEKTPQYQEKVRQMEKLNRGLIAVKTSKDTHEQTVDGVYLSWRLLGDEDLATQEYDIYKNGAKIYTTTGAKGTNYIDSAGTVTDKYKVVKTGASEAEVAAEPEITPNPNNYYAKPSEIGNGNSHKNSFTYVDIPIDRPDDIARDGDGTTSKYYTYDSSEGGANDGSIGDLDGDGDYEIVLKWDPTDSKDSASAGFTGRVYIDGYEFKTELSADGINRMWRIDLGQNVTAGAHYTQFIVYDFDGNGKAEIAMATAPGTIDGTGRYVTEVGDTEEIRNADNTALNIGMSGRSKGKNIGPEYYTIFDGETGAALCTTDAIPLESSDIWGDSKYNRAERFLSGVAYIDGAHPSFIACRGYYARAVVRAYSWDGDSLSLTWEHVGSNLGTASLYGQGNHNLSIADVDNDGFDEIVYGSATIDHDGTIIGNTLLGHGDAIHTSDFNNDGEQETFTVKESSIGYKNYAEDLRNPATGNHLWDSGKIITSGDNGRGVMANIDDEYAKTHSNALALGWSSGLTMTHDLNGDDVAEKPSAAGNGSFVNSLIYWDDDLSRELLDSNIIQKYNAEDGTTKRFYSSLDGYTLTGATTNNYTKRNATLSADIWGDWREEVIMPINKDSNIAQAYLRVFTSTIPSDYRITTLMHDSQYRTNVAIQNVGYNQPPHTSYYIGSAALATDDSGNALNYLAPAVGYTKVTYEAPQPVAVTGITISDDNKNIHIEKGKTVSINAVVAPIDATKKGITWTSSDTSVATVVNGVVKGVGAGDATITATTKDGGFTDTCEVSVFENSVNEIVLSETLIELGIDYTNALQATVYPDDATDKSVKWTSADTSVATVSGDGVVKGVSYGKTKVTATTIDGKCSAECIVKVRPIKIEDMTGEEPFDFTGENTDANITLNSTANSASLTFVDSSSGAAVQKVFPVYSDNKAILSFRLTTGGQKYDGTNWNWTGHEYTMGLSMLDADGNNILTVEQPYAASVGTLTSKIGANDAKGLISDWDTIVDNAGYVQGSAKRWMVTLEFDYANDVCNATISGTDANWTDEFGKYTKSFSLDGASFKTLQLYTRQDGTGAIKAVPKLENLSYKYEAVVSGNAEVVYETGTDNVPMMESEIDEWVQKGTEIAGLSFDNESGCMLYNPVQPIGEYSASKTFDLKENTLVTYDVDWYFGNAVARDGNFEYIQFGDKLRIGWTNGYEIWVSTDGGMTWNDNDGDGTPDSIFTGSNITFIRNIQVVFDMSKNTIKLFKFGGQEVEAYTNYQFSGSSTMDTVTLGFTRAGVAPAWIVPNGIERLKVSEFVYGDEEPDFPSIAGIVTYNANGGSDEPTAQTKTYGADLTLSSTKPTREGYTFLGWASTADAETAEYQAGGTYTADEGITLYAVWQIASYTVTYNANGGTGAPSAQTKTYGTDLTLSSTKPTRAGYTFLGWATSATATDAEYQASGTYTADADIALYAVWKINSYTITYDANGGTGAPSARTKTYGTNLMLSSAVPIRTGYTFLGWATSATATDAEYQAGGTYTANADVTLYAVWQKNTHTVTYNANGGTGAPSAQTKTYGADLTLSATVPVREGYTFLGWAASATATDAQYQAGGTYTADADITLYAVWKEFATSGTVGGISWTFSDGTLDISGSGAIPVFTAGGAPWYNLKNEIVKIIVRTGITTIGDSAFYGLGKASEVSLGNGVTTIGNGAFEGMSELKSITLPSGMNGGIGDRAFAYCTGLTAVMVPNGAVSIGEGAFEGCSALSEITVPFIGSMSGESNTKNTFAYIFGGTVPAALKKVTVTRETCIPENAFYGLADIETININSSIKSIGAGAFDGCQSLKNFTVPNGIGSIGDNTFRGCESAVSIIIPDTVKSIGEAAFKDCKKLTAVNIPDGVSCVYDDTFNGCSSLTSIKIPDSVTSIGTGVLAGCSRLVDIKVPFVGANSDPGDTAVTPEGIFGYFFGGANSDVPAKVTKVEITGKDKGNYIPKSAFKDCANIEDIIIDGGRSILDGAFANCRNLKNLYIPKSISTMGSNILEDCAKLETLTVPFIGTNRLDQNSETSVLGSFFGYDDSKITGTLQYYNDSKEYHYYKIPRTLKSVAVLNQTSIPAGAFMECDFLEKVSIVTGAKMNDYAFYHCVSLKKVTLPNDLQTIGYQAFAECENLETINIPTNVKTIGEQVFYNCRSIKNITIPDSVTEIADDVFNGTGLFSIDDAELAAYEGTITCSEGSTAYNYAVAKGIKTNVVDSSELDIKKTATTVTLLSDGSYLFDITDSYNMSGILHVELYDDNNKLIREETRTANDVEYRIEFAGDDMADVSSVKVYIAEESGETVSTEDENMSAADGDIPAAPESDIVIVYDGESVTLTGTTEPKAGAVLIEAVYGAGGAFKRAKLHAVTGLNEPIAADGAESGETVKFMLWNGFDKMKPLAETVEG